MPSINQYRKAWFALANRAARQSGIDRHQLQDDLTGKRSLTQWTPADFRDAVAHLQRLFGQHADPRPHVRAARPHGQALEDGERATVEQAELIEALCDSVAWRTGRDRGPAAYLTGRRMVADSMALRRETMRALDYAALGGDYWLHLFRQEAADLIRALQNMARRSQEAARV